MRPHRLEKEDAEENLHGWTREPVQCSTDAILLRGGQTPFPANAVSSGPKGKTHSDGALKAPPNPRAATERDQEDKLN